LSPLTTAAAGSRPLKLTQCMRSHGFPSWPDPEINANQISFLPPRWASPGNPKL
jgi:hypothetical protein